MAQITPKGDAARALLANLPEFSGGDKSVGALSDAYARRLANAAQRQLASGVTPSRQAARGHILTSEHKGGGAPKLPEQPATYKHIAKTSKETSLTGEAISRPSQGQRAALTGEPSPRLVHRRPPFQGHIPFGDGGEIYTVRSASEAKAQVRYAAELNDGHGERLTMQVYDCSKGTWFPVFRNTGHGQGINANALLEQAAEHGGSFDDFLIDTINERGSSSGVSGRISHACLFELTILPRQTAAVKTLRQRLG